MTLTASGSAATPVAEPLNPQLIEILANLQSSITDVKTDVTNVRTDFMSKVDSLEGSFHSFREAASTATSSTSAAVATQGAQRQGGMGMNLLGSIKEGAVWWPVIWGGKEWMYLGKSDGKRMAVPSNWNSNVKIGHTTPTETSRPQTKYKSWWFEAWGEMNVLLCMPYDAVLGYGSLIQREGDEAGGEEEEGEEGEEGDEGDEEEEEEEVPLRRKRF